MKIKLVLFTVLFALLMSCGSGSEDNNPEDRTEDAIEEGKKEQEQKEDDISVFPKSTNESYLEIEFTSGPIAGKHKFVLRKDDIFANLGVQYNFGGNGLLEITGKNLVSDNENVNIGLFTFSKKVIGEAKIEEENLPVDEGLCSSYEVRDTDDKNSKYDIFFSDAITCGNFKSEQLGKWKNASVAILGKTRGIIGSFTDKVTLRVTNDDGTKESILSYVNVKIFAIEKTNI